MNKIAIIAGIGGLVAGTAGGYCLCHFIEKKKIDKAISDGVQNALDEIRGAQRQKVMENEQKKSNIINAIPHFDGKDIVKDILKDNGYVSEDNSKEPEGSPDDDDDGLPFDAEKDARALELAEKHNIWDEPDPSNLENAEDYEARQEPEGIDMEKLDPTKPPYPIDEHQYNSELQTETEQGFWDKVTLIFFKDNVFAERTSLNDFQSMSSVEINAAIGKDNVKSFIEDRSVGRAFIRNNKLHIDYEIVRSPRTFDSALREDEEG